MKDTMHSKDRMDLGPPVKSDTGFRRRIRLHQAWYRRDVIGVPYGTGPFPSSKTAYGNMLDEDGERDGENFLTPRIRSVAEKRISAGYGTVDEFRLRRNMLSSQPMCFNLFGELACDVDLATVLARALWGDHVRKVTSVDFEWAPLPPADYLDDRTAFDAFIDYEASDGKRGFVAIETKLTEPFSRKVYKGSKYRRWMTQDAPWREDAADEVAHISHNQLWRDHLLAWALLKRPGSEYRHGRLAVVFHGKDGHAPQGDRGIPTAAP